MADLWQLWQLYARLGPAALRHCLDIEILADLAWFGDGVGTAYTSRILVNAEEWTAPGAASAATSRRRRGVRIALEKINEGRSSTDDRTPPRRIHRRHGSSRVVGYFVRVQAGRAGANLQGGQLLPWDGQTHRHAHRITCRAPLRPRRFGAARSTSSRRLHTGEVRGSPIAQRWAPAA